MYLFNVCALTGNRTGHTLVRTEPNQPELKNLCIPASVSCLVLQLEAVGGRKKGPKRQRTDSWKLSKAEFWNVLTATDTDPRPDSTHTQLSRAVFLLPISVGHSHSGI